MKTKETARLDEAVAAVRDEQIDLRAADGARARVWDTLVRETAAPTVAAIRGCDDVRALLPAHARRELSAPRALLVEDHLRECAACRAASQGTTAGAWRTGMAAPTRTTLRWRHAVAAAAVVGLGLLGYAQRDWLRGVPPGDRASVQSITGSLYRVADRDQTPLRPGDVLAEGELVRTGRASQAVLQLRDGSTVEMNERAEFSVSARRQDTILHLQRGNIIVQAAKRRVGHLYVAAEDCTVAVTGTVFSVSRGVKGSRVAVMEGEVHVRQGAQDTVLRPGQQVATSASLAPVPIRQEIAWSRNADRHLKVMAELVAMHDEWQRVPTPGMRYQARLLRGVPASAFVYVAAPNYGESLAQAYAIFEERVQQSEVLRQWWETEGPHGRAPMGARDLAEVVSRLQRLGRFVGDEIVVSFMPSRERHAVLFLAEVRGGGLREFLENEMFEGASRRPRLAFADDEAGIGATKADLYVLLRGDVVAASEDPATLRAAAAALDGRGNGLDRTRFGARIQQAYEDGASLLVAADTLRLRPQERPSEVTGLRDLQYFIAEHAEVDGKPRNSAELVFSGPRRGIGSWLGAPAPMGALDFVSPEATGVAAFVAKNPALVFDDMLALAGDPSKAQRELGEVESHLNIRIREDLAAALGSEFAIALDGPLALTPAVELIAEVYDPVRLEQTFETLVESANQELARQGKPLLHLDHEQDGTRTFHVLRGARLRSGTTTFELHYTFADGYLVAAPSRAFVKRALAVRESGRSVSRSDRFASMLAADGRTHVSALLYQNVGASGLPLLDLLGALPAERRQALEALAAQARPTLVYAYGEEDRIQVAGDLFSFDPSTLALPALLKGAVEAGHRRPAR
jgi:hypothetical protein